MAGSSPADSVRFLTLEEVLAVHEAVLETFGGEPGLRDPGLLESALHRPRSGYYADLASMAAAMLESLLINHPFVDGNKRVAFFATDVFCRLNGWSIRVEAEAANQFLEEHLGAGTLTFERILLWLRDHLVAHPGA